MSVQRRADGGAPGSRTMTVPSVHAEQPVPEGLRALSTMAAPDYLDAFTLAGGGPGSSPEQWARAMFEVVGGRGAQVIWRGVLAMRLHSAPDRIAGWAIGGRGPDWIRIEAASPFMAGHLLVRSTDDQVSFATFIHYDRRWAGLVWRPLSAAHRRLSPGLLTDAYRLLHPAG